jgi:cytochrome c556
MRALFALLVAGSAIAQQSQERNLKELMRSVPLPNSNIIFAVQSKPPNNDMDWKIVENAALAIEGSADLILRPGRVRSNGQPVPVQAADFIKYASALVPAGKDCLKATRKKSQDLVSYCTDGLSDACDNCHKVYRDKP